MAVPPPTAMPIRSAVLSSFSPLDLPPVSPLAIGVMLTAAPVEPVEVVGEPSTPPATFVEPADEDGNGKEVENVDTKDGRAIDDKLTRLVWTVELVGNGITGGVAWLTVGSAADGGAEPGGGGNTVKVVKVVGGGSTTVEVDASGGGVLVGGSGPAVDAVMDACRCK